MPSLNQGAYIREAIKSVINQGIDNYELIIMDGLSDDSTQQVLDEYSSMP
jgi:glycosyltransferase involved in cell wall biosynthesis